MAGYRKLSKEQERILSSTAIVLSNDLGYSISETSKILKQPIGRVKRWIEEYLRYQMRCKCLRWYKLKNES